MQRQTEGPTGELVVVRPGAPVSPPVAARLGQATPPVVFDGDLDDLHLQLCARGPARLVVDAARRGGLVARATLLVHHVERGGRLVVLLPPADGPHGRARRRLEGLVEQVAGLHASGRTAPSRLEVTDVRPREVRDLHALATSVVRATATTWAGEEAVVLEVGGPAVLATVPERDWADLLARRPDAGRTLLTVPGAPTPQRGRFESSDPSETAFTGDAPPLSLRAFDQAVCAPRQVAVTDRWVLPSTYRDPARGRLRIRSLVDWAPRAALAPDLGTDAPDDLPRLSGPLLHLDNVKRGHFGHALTEQLSVTWAWQEVRRRRPDARALVLAPPDGRLAAWERTLLGAAGIEDDDLVVATGPVVVEELLTATPGYAIGSYVHPALLDHWDRVGERLAARADPGPRPERVFLTRSADKRVCTDAAEVEALAVAHGFTLLRPETLGLAEQVAVVRAASAVAGYAGSGTFHLALAPRAVPVVVVSSATYPAANERQISAARGHDLHLVRGASAVTSSSRWVEVMHADYTLGPGGLAWLAERLAAL